MFKNSAMKQKLRLFTFLLYFFGGIIHINSQTTLIGGAIGNGDFEAGASSWTLVNAASTNQWFIGPVSPASGVNSAYISSDGGATNSYALSTTSTNHLYQPISFPAGETAIILSFDWKGVAEPSATAGSTFDYFRVSLATANPVGGSFTSTVDQLPVIFTGSPNYTKAYIVIPASNAGTTKNLIFTWRNDSSLGTPSPGPSIDNINLVSSIPSPISGTKNIPGDYSSISDVISKLNANGIGAGGVTVNVNAGSIFNETPPALTATGTIGNPIIFQKSGIGVNPIVTATGTGNFGPTSTGSVTGTGDGVIVIGGSDYVTFDGIDVQIGNFVGTSSCIEAGYLIRNSSATDGAQNNTIKNSNIILNRTVVSTSANGIFQSVSTSQGGVTPTSAAGANSSNKYLNNTITNAYNGIGLIGNATFPDAGNEVSNNIVGADYVGTPAGDIGGGSTATYGIQAGSQNNVKVIGNTIRNIGATTTTRGLYLNLLQGTDNNIYNNKIFGIRSLSTTSTSGINASEVLLATTGTHSLNFYNNFIYDVTSAYTGTASSTRQLRGILLGSGTSTSTYNISHNTIRLDGSGSPNISSVCLEWGGSAAIYNVRNNIFANVTGAQSGSAVHAGCRSTSGTTIGAATSICNYNDIYIANTTNGFVGITNATNQATLANWTAALTANPGTDANSVNANPGFTSPTDLHIDINNGGAFNVNNVGTPLPAVPTDIDGNTRNVTTPDLGADEFNLPLCEGTPNPGNTLASATSVCVGGSITLSLQNSTPGLGVTYQWYDNSGLIMGATNATYNVTINASNSFYCQVTCTSSASSGQSNPVAISIAPNPNGGDANGPANAVTSTLYNYTTTGSVGSLQWQFATTLNGTYSNAPGPTSTTTSLDVSFGSSGTFFFRVRATGIGCPEDFSDTVSTVVVLANDNVCEALTLNVGANGQYTNIGATAEPGEPTPTLGDCNTQLSWCSAGGNVSNSVWFKFTPAVKGQYDFALTATLFDSQFALWSVGDCNDFQTFELLAANDDITGVSPFNSKILPLCLDAGVTYYLQVDGFGTTTASNWGIAVTSIPAITYYADNDGDTFGDPNNSVIECTAPMSGYVTNDDDCDDMNQNVNPGAQEICNHIDDDCDQLIDEGVQFTFYADADNDQFGNPNVDTLDCTAPLGYVSNNDDCNDQVMTINPYAAEACDEVDNDCDELIDEGCGCTDPTAHNYDSEATIDDGSCETCSDGIKNGSEVNIDCGGNNPNCPTCPPPTAVCGNIVTVYTGGGAPVYNGPGASDVWNIPAAAFDAGSVVYGTLSNRQVKRKYTNIAFNWTTDGSCIDATPNGVYNNNDKGLVYRNCLPVAPSDFGKIRNFDMTISDQFGTSTCEGRYIVINSAPPSGSAPVYTIEQEAALIQALEDESEFSVFPNPGIDQIFIKTDYEEGLDKSVVITDITGRQVLKIKKLTSSLINVDTQSLGLGTYTITLNSASGTKSIKWLKVQ